MSADKIPWDEILEGLDHQPVTINPAFWARCVEFYEQVLRDDDDLLWHEMTPRERVLLKAMRIVANSQMDLVEKIEELAVSGQQPGIYYAWAGKARSHYFKYREELLSTYRPRSLEERFNSIVNGPEEAGRLDFDALLKGLADGDD